MAYKKITVPAAGESDQFNMTGVSVVVVQSPAYFNADDCPKLSFNNPGDEVPIKQTAKWPNPEGAFKNVVVTGTSESAGDEIILKSLNLCIEPYFPPPSETKKSVAGTTSSKAANDAVQSFTELELEDANGNLPSRLYIYVTGGATRGINYAFNDDPSQGYPPSDSYYWDNEQANGGATQPSPMEPLEIDGIDWILNFRFIAAVAGETPDLIWTAEY